MDTTNPSSCDSSFTCPFVEEIDIERIINHEQYDHDDHLNDISLYRLETPVDKSLVGQVNPICLPINEEIRQFRPKKFVQVGWNEVVNSKGAWITDLPRREVEIVDCNNGYYHKKFHSFTTAFCVSKENCSYLDFGVALQGKQEHNGVEKYFLYGQKIEGSSSCDVPDAFLDISKYLPWIAKHVKL
jgi:hypothetical protein